MDFRDRYEYYARLVIEEHQAVFTAQNIEELQRFMSAIIEAKRIFVVGAGREGIAARSFSMRLMHLGKAVFWLWDDTTPGMKEGDLFIAIDGSGAIGHIDYLVNQALRTGAKTAVITGDPGREIPRKAHILLFVPAAVYKGTDSRVIPSAQPMGNLFEQHLFLLFDIIIMLLREEMGLTFEQMESYHRNIE